MRKNQAIFSILILLLFCHSVSAQEKLNDDAEISLLTASPWHGAVYALFGHTALRLQDDSLGIDIVFNYGYFDSTQPNFIYNFVRGQTDYVLGITAYEDFEFEYSYKGQEVVEQTLNLSNIEKQRLYDALFINAQPENMRYRYNYFYDNCATRPRDMIERYTQNEIIYPPTNENQTYRDLLHECLHYYPWTEFGVDLMIGSDADKVIDAREKMYIPAYLMSSFEGAYFQNGDSLSNPLVSKSEIIISLDSERNRPGEGIMFTPAIIAFALLLVAILISLLQVIKLSKIPLIYDTIIFGITGLGGVVIFVLMYLSEHPATIPNWNFVWMNIFALIAAMLFWLKPAKNIVYFYHLINFVVLTLFVLLWWLIPQQLPFATIPFALSLWFRSGTNMMMLRRKRIKNNRFTSSKHLKAGWGQ